MFGPQICRCSFCLCLLLAFSAVASADAQFRPLAGYTDFNFKLDPASPTELDIISFYDPSGGGGSNACFAAMQIGSPFGPIKIANVIQVLYLDPFVGNCTAIVDPVA